MERKGDRRPGASSFRAAFSSVAKAGDIPRSLFFWSTLRDALGFLPLGDVPLWSYVRLWWRDADAFDGPNVPAGGSLVRLPRDRGFVALKTESPASSKISRGKNRPLSVVAYFYQTDGTTPMSPAPTDVVFKVGNGADAKPVTLTPDASDPNRFVSTPGIYPRGLQGTIQAKVNGESVEEIFSSQ